MPDNQCAYFIIRLKFIVDLKPCNKILFISWIPDSAPFKQKITYTDSMKNVLSLFPGIILTINSTGLDDIDDGISSAYQKLIGVK